MSVEVINIKQLKIDYPKNWWILIACIQNFNKNNGKIDKDVFNLFFKEIKKALVLNINFIVGLNRQLNRPNENLEDSRYLEDMKMKGLAYELFLIEKDRFECGKMTFQKKMYFYFLINSYDLKELCLSYLLSLGLGKQIRVSVKNKKIIYTEIDNEKYWKSLQMNEDFDFEDDSSILKSPHKIIIEDDFLEYKSNDTFYTFEQKFVSHSIPNFIEERLEFRKMPPREIKILIKFIQNDVILQEICNSNEYDYLRAKFLKHRKKLVVEIQNFIYKETGVSINLEFIESYLKIIKKV